MRAARWGITDVVVELVRGGANLDLQNKVQVEKSHKSPRQPCTHVDICVMNSTKVQISRRNSDAGSRYTVHRITIIAQCTSRHLSAPPIVPGPCIG